MSDKFRVGDKVRVLRGFEGDAFAPLTLAKGAVYTVTEIVDAGPNQHGNSDYGINVDNNDGGYGAWDADRFELVTDDVKTPDIPAGVQDAYYQASELFSTLTEHALVAVGERKPNTLAYLRFMLGQLDAVLRSLEDAYPTLDKESD